MSTSKTVQSFLALVAGIFLMTSVACRNSIAPNPTCRDEKASNYGQPGDCVPWPAQPPAESYVKIVSMAPPSGSTRSYLEYPGPGGVSAGQTELVLEYGISQADQNVAMDVGGKIKIQACLSTTATPILHDKGCVGPEVWLGPTSSAYGRTTLAPYMHEKFRGVITQTQYIVIEMYWEEITKKLPSRTINIQYLPWVLNFD